MKVIVAGANGYIGARVARGFVGIPNTTVLTLGRRAPSHRQVDFVSSSHALREMLDEFEPDVVINCVGTTSANLRVCVDSHVIATTNLLAAMAEVAPGSRLVQLGSAAEYGQAVPAPLLINEDTPPLPQGAYGISKLASTLLAATHGPALGLDCIVLRIFNLIGPDMASGTIVPKVLGFLGNIGRQLTDPIELGTLDGYRDFIHIDDVVSAVIAATFAPSLGQHAIINIASGEPVMVRVLVRRILDAAGHKGEIHEIATGSSRSAGVTWQHADVSRARRLLGWAPKRNLLDSILELVRGYGDNRT